MMFFYLFSSFLQKISYLLTVIAEDNGLFETRQNTALLNITIFPSNNMFPPELEDNYIGTIDENNPINASILVVTATDDDLPSPASMIDQFILSGIDADSFTIENLGNNSAILRAG